MLQFVTVLLQALTLNHKSPEDKDYPSTYSEQWFSERGPRTSSVSVTWELARHVISQAPPLAYGVKNTVGRAQKSV